MMCPWAKVCGEYCILSISDESAWGSVLDVCDSHGTTSAQMVWEIDAFHECMRENERKRNVRNDVGDQWRKGQLAILFRSTCQYVGEHKYTHYPTGATQKWINNCIGGKGWSVSHFAIVSRFSSRREFRRNWERGKRNTVDHSAIAACARLLFSSIAS